jgi:hypothetical protein
MKKVRLAITLLAVLAIVSFAGQAPAATSSDSYKAVTSTISAPDTVSPFTDFAVVVGGEIMPGSGFDVFAFSVRQDAEWEYDANHMVVWTTPGTIIEQDAFNFGSSHTGMYTFNLPEGVYKFTYMFGFRSTGDNWYDVAVDVWVLVGEQTGDEDEDTDGYPDEMSD